MRSISLPASSCANVTATPVISGDWLLLQQHDHGNCTPASTYGRSLLGLKLSDGLLYRIYSNVSGEGTLTVVPQTDRIYWNTTFGSTTRILTASTLGERVRVSLGSTSDSSGVHFADRYFLGTINSPENGCQQPINKACGGVYALDDSGNVVARRDVDTGIRAWMAAGYTSDGSALYVGTAPQHYGTGADNEATFRYGCNVLKFDTDLKLLASYDPGATACHHNGRGGDDEDAVAGETVLAPGAVWVYYHGANRRADDGNQYTTIARLDRNLAPICSLELNVGTLASGAFYGGPTVDRDGNAYFPLTLPIGDASSGRKAVLLAVAPDCSSRTVFEEANQEDAHSPTLVDDRVILYATGGKLRALRYDGTTEREWTLASSARVNTSPVLHQGLLYVAQSDGTLNIIRNSGYSGYGTAPWPRYRRDNEGSATYTGALPGAPTITGIVAGPGSAVISFAIPADPGGSGIIAYTATCTASGQTARSASGSASPINVRGLTPGTSYQCAVAASNAAGTGTASTGVSVVPEPRHGAAPLLLLLD